MEKTEKNGKTENKIFHPMISKKQKLHEANISVFSVVRSESRINKDS